MKRGREIEMRSGDASVTIAGSSVTVDTNGSITLDSGGDTLVVQ